MQEGAATKPLALQKMRPHHRSGEMRFEKSKSFLLYEYTSAHKRTNLLHTRNALEVYNTLVSQSEKKCT